MKHNIFTAEHEMLRKTIRAFVEKEVAPQVAAWEEAGRIPREFWRRMGQLGLLGLDFPVEGFFRDVRLWTIASGTSEVMREIIAKRLLT